MFDFLNFHLGVTKIPSGQVFLRFGLWFRGSWMFWNIIFSKKEKGRAGILRNWVRMCARNRPKTNQKGGNERKRMKTRQQQPIWRTVYQTASLELIHIKRRGYGRVTKATLWRLLSVFPSLLHRFYAQINQASYYTKNSALRS